MSYYHYGNPHSSVRVPWEPAPPPDSNPAPYLTQSTPSRTLPPLPPLPRFPHQHVPATYDRSEIHSEFHPASHPDSHSVPRYPPSVHGRLGPRPESVPVALQTSLGSVHSRLNFDPEMHPSLQAPPQSDEYEELVAFADADQQGAVGLDNSQDYGYPAPYPCPELTGGGMNSSRRRADDSHRRVIGGYGGEMEGGFVYGGQDAGSGQTHTEEGEPWEEAGGCPVNTTLARASNGEIPRPVPVPPPVSRIAHRLSRGEQAGPALGGYIFGCDNGTHQECLKRNLFGTKGHVEEVQRLQEGSKLFLFHFQKRILYGVYEAKGAGGRNLVAEAFNGKFPSQIRFREWNKYGPLSEDQFQPCIAENYFQPRKFSYKLSEDQVQRLVTVFHNNSLLHPEGREGRGTPPERKQSVFERLKGSRGPNKRQMTQEVKWEEKAALQGSDSKRPGREASTQQPTAARRLSVPQPTDHRLPLPPPRDHGGANKFTSERSLGSVRGGNVHLSSPEKQTKGGVTGGAKHTEERSEGVKSDVQRQMAVGVKKGGRAEGREKGGLTPVLKGCSAIHYEGLKGSEGKEAVQQGSGKGKEEKGGGGVRNRQTARGGPYLFGRGKGEVAAGGSGRDSGGMEALRCVGEGKERVGKGDRGVHREKGEEKVHVPSVGFKRKNTREGVEGEGKKREEAKERRGGEGNEGTVKGGGMAITAGGGRHRGGRGKVEGEGEEEFVDLRGVVGGHDGNSIEKGMGGEEEQKESADAEAGLLPWKLMQEIEDVEF